MPSTYTLNNGIELIGTGEQSGTWGDTTNTNLGLLDAALDGQVTITLGAAGSSGSPNALPITDGTTSNGRNRMVVFADGGDLGATAYVQLTPNDAEKIIYIRNSLSGSRAVILFQGTYNASNDYEVPAGTTAVVYFDGAGAGAVAANVFNNAYFDGLRLGSVSVTAILDEDNMASDSAAALATQQSIKAYVDAQVGTVDTLAEILAIGNTTGATDIAVDSAQKVQFRDAAIYINSSVDGQLDIVADTEIQIAATTVDVNGALDVSGTALVTGVLTTTAATVSNGGGQFNGAINVGVDDTGYDVKFFGATTGKSLLWDESADSLIVTGTTTLVGTTNLDAVDIDGATQIDATVTVGVDDTGYDVKFFGATAGAYMLWDESADDLILGGAAGLSVNSTALVTGVLTTTAATVFNGGFTANADSTLGTDKKVQFRDAAIYINSSVDGQLDIVADTEIQIAATTVDVNGALDVSGTALVTGVLTTTAATVSNGGGQFNGAINVGVDDTGYDVKFFGATAGAYMLWDESADDLILGGAAGLSVNSTALVTGVLTANGGAVFNESGADVDFRVESDTDANALFVEGSSGNVGIGTTSPRVKLDLRSDAVIAAPTPLANAVTSGVFAIGDSVGSVVGLQLNGSSYDTYIQSRNMGAGSAAYNLLLQPLGGNVGIGTSSPDTTTKLTVAGAITVTGANTGHGASRLKLGQDTSAISQIRFYGADNSTAGILQFTGSSADSTVGGERMRLTSSGELLVGTTTSRPAEFTHPAGFSVGGAATGQVQSSTDGDTCLFLNRDTSDGTLVEFRKDGTTVGSIGTYVNLPYIGKSDVNLLFDPTGPHIIPRGTDGGARDAAINLGSSSNRFKDLYLSGGVYLGGAVAANLLDDYEEGSFTATLTSAVAPTSPPTASGRYTKIGRSVTVSIFIENGDTSGGSGVMRIDGLPFEAGAAVGNRGSGPVQFYDMTFSGAYCVAEAGGASTSIYFRSITSNAAWSDQEITAGTGKYLQTTMTYTTA
jgi:hypothetical protein